MAPLPARLASLSEAWFAPALLTLEDAAALAGCTPRRFRYLMARGLVPKAARKGPNAGYGRLHVAQAVAVLALLASRRYQTGELADLIGPRSRARFEQAAALRSSSVIHQLRRRKVAPLVEGLVLHTTSTLSPFVARYVQAIVLSIHQLALADEDCIERAEAAIRELQPPAAFKFDR